VKMKVMIVLASALALAACGQTSGSARRAPPAQDVKAATVPAKPGAPQQIAERCAGVANRMAETQTKAAMLGGALNMVGGLGGFGGRGGMVAAQAASVGGQVVQSQAQAKAQSQMQQECM
jgi:hypothetical protein